MVRGNVRHNRKEPGLSDLQKAERIDDILAALAKERQTAIAAAKPLIGEAAIAAPGEGPSKPATPARHKLGQHATSAEITTTDEALADFHDFFLAAFHDYAERRAGSDTDPWSEGEASSALAYSASLLVGDASFPAEAISARATVVTRKQIADAYMRFDVHLPTLPAIYMDWFAGYYKASIIHKRKFIISKPPEVYAPSETVHAFSDPEKELYTFRAMFHSVETMGDIKGWSPGTRESLLDDARNLTDRNLAAPRIPKTLKSFAATDIQPLFAEACMAAGTADKVIFEGQTRRWYAPALERVLYQRHQLDDERAAFIAEQRKKAKFYDDMKWQFRDSRRNRDYDGGELAVLYEMMGYGRLLLWGDGTIPSENPAVVNRIQTAFARTYDTWQRSKTPQELPSLPWLT